MTHCASPARLTIGKSPLASGRTFHRRQSAVRPAGRILPSAPPSPPRRAPAKAARQDFARLPKQHKQRTLSYACHQQVEAEANFAAGRLLFLQEAFDERVKSEPVTFDQVKKLGKEFGNTMTSTLWRTVESVEEPLFGMVSQHPRRATDESKAVIRYFLRSKIFADQFPGVTAVEVFESLQAFCFGNRGPIGSAEVIYRDAGGQRHVFFVETFFNHHEALTLGVHRRKQSVVVGVN